MTAHGHYPEPGFLHAHWVASLVVVAAVVAAAAAASALAWQATRASSPSPVSPAAATQSAGNREQQVQQWLGHYRTYQGQLGWLTRHQGNQDRQWAAHYSGYMNALTWLRDHRAYGHGRSLDDYRVSQDIWGHNQWLGHHRAYQAELGWLLRHPAQNRQWQSHHSTYLQELQWLRDHRAYEHRGSLDGYRTDQMHLRWTMNHHRSWSGTREGTSYGSGNDHMDRQMHDSWGRDGSWR